MHCILKNRYFWPTHRNYEKIESQNQKEPTFVHSIDIHYFIQARSLSKQIMAPSAGEISMFLAKRIWDNSILNTIFPNFISPITMFGLCVQCNVYSYDAILRRESLTLNIYTVELAVNFFSLVSVHLVVVFSSNQVHCTRILWIIGNG